MNTAFLSNVTAPTDPVEIDEPATLTSGLGWDAIGRGFSMISPQHAVQANHYRTPVGETATFMGIDGIYYEAEVIDQTHIGADLTLATFAMPMPATVEPFTLADAANLDVGTTEIFVYGKNGLIGSNTLSRVSGGYVVFGTANNPTGAMPVNGDSGRPTLVEAADGSLQLLSIHFALNSHSNPTMAFDTYLNHHFQALNTHTMTLGYAVAVPEPSTVVMWGVVGIALVVWFIRRRKAQR